MPPQKSYASNLYVERDVEVTARRSGIIEEVLVRRGERVRRHQPLAILERDLASRELEIAEQDLELARSEFAQVKSLHDQEIASEHEFLLARMARDQAASRVKLQQALLERCTVEAPFDGTVVERWTVPGQRVREEDGVPLFRVVASDRLRARVDVPERHLRTLAVDSPAWIEGPGNPFPPLSAKVVFVGPAIDAASGTVPVIVELQETHPGLRVGASVSISFEESVLTPTPLLRIPREALTRDGSPEEGPAILYLVEHDTVRARRVEVVELRGTSALIRGPLSSDDRIIHHWEEEFSVGDSVSPEEVAP